VAPVLYTTIPGYKEVSFEKADSSDAGELVPLLYVGKIIQ